MSVSELALLLQGYLMAVCTNCRTLKYMAPLHIIVLLASISCSTSIYHFYVKLYNTLKFYKSPFILASNLPQIIYHTSQLFTHFLSLLIRKIGDETKKHRQKHQQGPEPDKPNHQLWTSLTAETGLGIVWLEWWGQATSPIPRDHYGNTQSLA